MSRKELKSFFRHNSTKIRVWVSVDTIQDPYEQNVSRSYLPCKVIRAITSDLSPTQVAYKMTGIVTNRAKEVIIEKKYENLLKISQKITIDGDDYEGWKVSGKLSYRLEHDYIRFYCYQKQESND